MGDVVVLVGVVAIVVFVVVVVVVGVAVVVGGVGGVGVGVVVVVACEGWTSITSGTRWRRRSPLRRLKGHHLLWAH